MTAARKDGPRRVSKTHCDGRIICGLANPTHVHSTCVHAAEHALTCLRDHVSYKGGALQGPALAAPEWSHAPTVLLDPSRPPFQVGNTPPSRYRNKQRFESLARPRGCAHSTDQASHEPASPPVAAPLHADSRPTLALLWPNDNAAAGPVHHRMLPRRKRRSPPPLFFFLPPPPPVATPRSAHFLPFFFLPPRFFLLLPAAHVVAR